MGKELNLHSPRRAGYSRVGSPLPSPSRLGQCTREESNLQSPYFEYGRYASSLHLCKNGASGGRTHNLLDAIQMLSLLSYGPMWVQRSSFEVSPLSAGGSVLPRWRRPPPRTPIIDWRWDDRQP